VLSANELAVDELFRGHLISFIIHYCNSKFVIYHVEKHSELGFRIFINFTATKMAVVTADAQRNISKL
jgi:hypothetical protein